MKPTRKKGRPLLGGPVMASTSPLPRIHLLCCEEALGDIARQRAQSGGEETGVQPWEKPLNLSE